ncbi:ABC transporter substrate-binding protein [Aquibium microcysteis]|uniref:ABC transporter substrate-binding protein n=1 Tax=Aquibium microcysteis TaxID=675281 RepID=UPI00165CF31A|nr:extracellular solute-binding protein [Aquibium microcysteis]
MFSKTFRALAAAGALMFAAPAMAQDVSPEWQKVIDAAKQEGRVTIYSAQGLKQLNDLGAKFKEKYGIEVEVVRAIEADFLPKLKAEFDSGTGIADVAIITSTIALKDLGQQGYFVPATGPAFENPDYKKSERMTDGMSFMTNATILTYSWNTELVPDGIKDYDDIFKKELEGLIGIPRASVSTIVDFYFYLEENYGADYVERLAAMKPRIYPSALTMAQALSAGEVGVILFGEPQVDEKAAGAPVESGFGKVVWGARFFGNVTKVAPHPNAAQLLANFIVTPEGQAAIARKTAATLPNIPGAVAEIDSVRVPDASKLTKENVEAFQARFNQLFGSN